MRSSRALVRRGTAPLVLVIVALVLVIVGVSKGSVKQSPTVRSLDTKVEPTQPIQELEKAVKQRAFEAKFLKRQAATIRADRTAVWTCQDALGIPRSKASTSGWALQPSIPYRSWVSALWSKRKQTCNLALQQRTIPTTGDWLTAVRLVQRVYPGTAQWLLFISDREGGHGPFVMNHQGSPAGGWMQFYQSTYLAYADDAFADLRRRGFIVDPKVNSWYHPMGQAITAAYMRFTGRDGCHWCL